MANDKKIQGYQQGAVNSLKLQRQMEAAGNQAGAKLAAESVNANLDAAAALKKKGS